MPKFHEKINREFSYRQVSLQQEKCTMARFLAVNPLELGGRPL